MVLALVTAFLVACFGLMTAESSFELPPHSPNNSMFRSPSKPNNRMVLMASHLRRGSDGELRLRIIEHNLLMLSSGCHKPFKAVIIFSLDDGVSPEESDALHMVGNWQHHMDPAISTSIRKVMFVPNDAVLVDSSKWMVALEELLPEIRRTNARVMLVNDSFVLTRGVPELWDDQCGDVCGLAWTAPKSDPTRHIQSYIRSLSSLAVERYMKFFEESKENVYSVNELIQLFEINLDWVKEDGFDGSVSAMYEYAAGAHSDSDQAQKVR